MILHQILLQTGAAATDSVGAGVAPVLHPDSLANLTPDKIKSTALSVDWSALLNEVSQQAVSLALRLAVAILIFVVGKFIINKLTAIVRAIFLSKNFDRSLSTFLLSLLKMTLLFLLVITVIGVAGIETSSFIAIFASAGVAIGMALSGTLQNFAGGVLILINKPYKVGDYIEFGSFKGTVKEIQIFNTIITTLCNEQIIIPNGGLSTGTITNYTAEDYRRAQWRVSISYGDDTSVARRVIKEVLDNDPRVVQVAPEVADPAAAVGLDTAGDNDNDTVDNSDNRSWWQRLVQPHKERVAQWRETAAEQMQRNLPKRDFTPMIVVESLDDSAVVILVRAWVNAPDYWSVFFDLNEAFYNTLPKHGIHFPFPQLDVHIDHE